VSIICPSYLLYRASSLDITLSVSCPVQRDSLLFLSVGVFNLISRYKCLVSFAFSTSITLVLFIFCLMLISSQFCSVFRCILVMFRSLLASRKLLLAEFLILLFLEFKF